LAERRRGRAGATYEFRHQRNEFVS